MFLDAWHPRSDKLRNFQAKYIWRECQSLILDVISCLDASFITLKKRMAFYNFYTISTCCAIRDIDKNEEKGYVYICQTIILRNI